MSRVLSVVAHSRVYPHSGAGKRFVPVALLLAVAIPAAGCGGGGSTTTAVTTQAPTGQVVVGTGFAFRTPAAWIVKTSPGSAVARRDETTLVSVTVLPLVRAYKPSQFGREIGPLDRAAAGLAAKLKGSVTAKRTVVVAGGKTRQYDIAHGGLVDRFTFVLRGKRNFELTCRWRKQDGAPDACAELLATFRFR